MITRAMKITGLTVNLGPDEAVKLLKGFEDSAQFSAWAQDGMASCVMTGIASGKGGNLLAPKDNITRAEVAVIIRRLLQKSNLI